MFRPDAAATEIAWSMEFPISGVHTREMTDQWNEQLCCPNCRKTGMASLTQGKDDQMPAVQSVPEGFKVVQTEYGPDFHCMACNIAVEP
ncbi:MAG: hypothetical protein JWR80_825 [Bradyrhizobium sp.]|nr:hypothetical protein [Bradyrhizobium sp.]